MGDCLFTLGSYLKITEVVHVFGNLIPRLNLCINQDYNGLGYILGDFFAKSSGQPGVDVMITVFCDFRQFSAQKLAFFSKTNVMIKI
jgi:hypothetical protein